MAAPPQQPQAGTTAPPAQAKPRPDTGPKSPLFYGGSSGVLTVKVLAMVMIFLSILWYYIFISYSDSDFIFTSYIIAGVTIGVGVLGVWMGNFKITSRAGIPSLNTIFIMASIFLLFLIPVLGSWQDTRTLGEMFDSEFFILNISLYAFFSISYIEFSHAAIRFSQIDQYAKSQNIEDFSVNPVIWNYFFWYGILFVVIYAFMLVVIFLRWGYMPALEESAPQFANSIEMNSVYSIALSIGLIFVPIAAILSYVFGAGSLIKTTKEVIVKGPDVEDEYSLGTPPPPPPPGQP
jgi:hypothetical protein